MTSAHPLRLVPLAALALVVMLWPAPPAGAFINPSFTPVDLVRQSDVILHVRFERVDDDGTAVAEVVEILKGREVFDDDDVRFALLAGAFEAQGREVMAAIRSGQTDGLMFIGLLPSLKEGDGLMDDDEAQRGFLHLGGRGAWSAKQWVMLEKWEDGWDMIESRSFLLGTWAGGTDMLIRAVRYILADPEATVPIVVGVEWDEPVVVGKLDGPVRQVAPVDLEGDGRCELFVASEAGDRVWRFDDGRPAEITKDLGLVSRSRMAVWSDFNADGRADLASYDGECVNTLLTDGAGRLARGPSAEVAGECLGLDALDAGGPAVLISTTNGPRGVKVTPRGMRPMALPTGEPPQAEPAPMRRCLVADIDADGHVDVLQPHGRGSLLYRGMGPGKWKAPVDVDVFCGTGRFGACLADLDQDGKLDVMVAAEDFCRLWQNRGDGTFVERLELSGEIGYITKPGAVACQAGDVNNDGLQDVLIVYPGTRNPQIFFNRGYRSFGHGRELDLSLDPAPVAACLGDFTGDGAVDLAVADVAGAIRVFPRKVADDPPLAAVVSLTADAGTIGPLTVIASTETRPLGAWSIRAGGPPAVIGVPEPMAVRLRWHTPDGKEHTRTVVPEEGAVRVRIGKP
ncbi:MAG: FG-GAP repeat domain-containing protein [Planctomycetota bacterium]